MIEKYGIKTLDDIDILNKTVLTRVDINSPVDKNTGKITDITRILNHLKTIRELVNRKAKTIIIAHQGRPGEPDFISLKQHAEILSKLLDKEVKFVDDIFGKRAVNAIRSLRNGEVLMLENVRMWPGEMKKGSVEVHAGSQLVKNLSPLIDVFVFDAFAAAHRVQASTVGFIPVVKEVVIGRVMEAELKALLKVVENPKRPIVYILGGAKAEDSAELSNKVLSEDRADKILTGGLVANLFLLARDVDIGEENKKVLEKRGFLSLIPSIRELFKKFEDKIELPVDLAIDELGKRKEIGIEDLPTNLLIKDVGNKTCEKYSKIILDAKTIVMNGPMGIYEDDRFALATIKVFESIIHSNAFSLIGGGHTVAAATKFKVKDKFGYVSTGGGALMKFLMEKSLPVLEILKKYSR